MIVGVSGKARSGKNVFAEMLAEELYKRTGQAYVMMAYADELKEMAQKELGLTWDQLWGDDKEVKDKRYMKWLPEDEVYVPWTAREIMQSLGDFYRGFDPQYWVKRLFKKIKEKEYENVIITDVRFPNEVDLVVENGGYHIRVNRPIDNKIHGKAHASETSLDAPYKVDFSIVNSGTLDDLRKLAGDVANGMIQLQKFGR